ncbi:MAG: sigma 54-interacting transcriptional regulator [Polyangiales bacterium]
MSKNQFDDETQVRPDRPSFARTALRAYPDLHWTDSAGAHVHNLASRATIGSADHVDVVVHDRQVSRLHAEIELRDDGAWIRDLGSRNGTFVGDVRVVEARVPENAQIRVGGSALTLRAAPVPTAIDLWPHDYFGALVGRSAVMREMFARLARVAKGDGTVLLHGETGTGKELAARAIHDASPRVKKPFVVVDCAALPETLLESELFGHKKGAFTGAIASQAGAIEVADGGTIFLDEIGELPPSMQPKLLRVLEARTVRRVGESNHKAIDVRFVSATNRDLRAMVNAGAFREDLYFRLAVLPVTIPPLRAHLEDLPLLIQQFVTLRGGAPLSPELITELASRPWLGNVRELRNVVDRALALGEQEAFATHAPIQVGGERFPDVSADEPFKEIRERWVAHLEREYVRKLLAKHPNNMTAAAEAAGLDRTYLYRLIKKHDL